MTETANKLPPQNEEAETSLLGAAMLGNDGRRVLTALSADHGLRPEHFYRERHRLIFVAMLALTDRNEPIDVLTVTEEMAQSGDLELAGGPAYVHSLPNLVPSAGSWPSYAKIVRKHAYMRSLLTAARELEASIYGADDEAISMALGKLSTPEQVERRVTIESRMEALAEHMERRVETLAWPFARLDEMTGGMWPGHLTILVGWSAHGKSVLADQILERVVKRGARCCAYLTEMTPLERDLRFVARRTDIPLMRLQHAEFESDLERRRYVKAIQQVPFEIQPAGTWKVEQVGHDIRRRGLNVAVVDLLNAISGRETKDIDESVARLAGIANDTGCHVVACQHLNRSRLTGGIYPPEPARGDIRGSGAIFDLSTNVLSVYRREREDVNGDPTGEEGDDAVIRFLKVKNGITGKMDARFNGSRMRFEMPADPGTVGIAA